MFTRRNRVTSKKLLVDYGTHVKAGQVMAILEIPELEAQLQEDQAEIKNAVNQVSRAQDELYRYQAQYKALHLQYTRLNGVFESQPGIVAQQEVDDAQGKDMAASSQVDAGQAALEAARSQLSVTNAKLVHDQSLFDYSQNHGSVCRSSDGTLRKPRHAGAGGYRFEHAGNADRPAVRGRSFPARDSGSGVLRSVYPRRRPCGRSRAVAQPDVPGKGSAVLGGCKGRNANHAHGG